MFTGIILEKGQISSLRSEAKSTVIKVKADKALNKAIIGSSIAVNGVCLTVTNITSDMFEADVMPETVKRSNLFFLRPGSFVNIEPALRIGDEIGGHMVSGHIDDVGIVESIAKDSNAIWMTINANESIMGQIVLKGSVALDGVSLTVSDLTGKTFSVSLIPLTANFTTLGEKKVGDKINIETDIIGKYVEKYIKAYGQNKEGKITLAMLTENGFA